MTIKSIINPLTESQRCIADCVCSCGGLMSGRKEHGDKLIGQGQETMIHVRLLVQQKRVDISGW